MLIVTVTPTAPYRGLPIPRLFPDDEDGAVRNDSVRASRTAARTVLLRLLREEYGLAPAPGSLLRDEYGRPAPVGGVYFSLSHTDRFAAAAVSDAPCGVDIEEFTRTGDFPRLAQKVLTDEEQKRFPAPTPEQFLRLWTAKESIFKCRGHGTFVPRTIEADDGVVHAETDELLIALCGDVSAVRLIILNGS